MRPRPITFPGQQVVNMAVLGCCLSGPSSSSGSLHSSRSPSPRTPVLHPLSCVRDPDDPPDWGCRHAGSDLHAIPSPGLQLGLTGSPSPPPNYAMVIAGIIVGAAGTLLTRPDGTSNEPLDRQHPLQGIRRNGGDNERDTGQHQIDRGRRRGSHADACQLRGHRPGCRMAVARPSEVRAMEQLESRNVAVKFAIHPVA